MVPTINRDIVSTMNNIWLNLKFLKTCIVEIEEILKSKLT
jgi:hypothetical protein